MSISIAVGGEFFDRLREDHCYYVDKTELIYDLVHGTNNVEILRVLSQIVECSFTSVSAARTEKCHRDVRLISECLPW